MNNIRFTINMNKYLIFLIGMFLCSVAGSAQYQKATDEQRKEIVNKLKQASSNVNTMKCDFTQVKEIAFMDEKVTSEGKMFYKKPNNIRWEYTKPYQYALSMDGKNIRMMSGDKTTTMPPVQKKLFDEIYKVMLISINGMGLVDSPEFDTELFVGSDDYKLTLTSKKKEMKEFFTSIQIYANKPDNRIRSFELIEKGGDKISITLKNIQLNTTISDTIFSQ